MGRSPCCDKVGLKKGPWTPAEDRKLTSYIQQHGHGSWRALPPKAGLKRCGKSCRLRWTNYLRPDIKRGKFSLQEEQTIIQLHALLGNRWSTIASHLPKRTDNEIKNYWNTHIKKRLNKMGIDPMTHKPKHNALLGSGQSKDMANLSHIAQWESTRLEAEARIVRESKFSMNPYHSMLVNKFTAIAGSASVLTLPSPRPPCLDILKAWQATKPRKGILSTIVNSGSLESPTSILNFSENVLVSTPIVGLIHENLSKDASCVGNTGAPTNNDQDEQGKDITLNSLQSNDNMMELGDSLRFLSFLEEGFADLPPIPSPIPCMVWNASSSAQDNVDNKINYWSDILDEF